MDVIESDFYISLLSNVKHPCRINTTSHFYTELRHKLFLDDSKWKVALSELHVPITWFNINEHPMSNRHIRWATSQIYIKEDLYEDLPSLLKDCEQLSFGTEQPSGSKLRLTFFSDSEKKKKIGFFTNYNFEFYLKYGYYNYIQDLVAELNSEIKKQEENNLLIDGYTRLKTRCCFEHNKISGQIGLIVGAGYKFTCSPYLANLFTFDHPEKENNNVDEFEYEGYSLTSGNGALRYLKHNTREKENLFYKIVKGNAIPDLSYFSSNIFIYSNIVERSFVGNDLHQIIRIIRGDGLFGDYLKMTFENPYYIPLIDNCLQEIEISIKDDQGKLIQFQYGKILLILNFSKTK